MSHGEHINTMLPCRQTSSILANKLQYLNLDDARSTSKGLRVLCEKVDFHRTGAYHHHNNRFWEEGRPRITIRQCKRGGLDGATFDKGS